MPPRQTPTSGLSATRGDTSDPHPDRPIWFSTPTSLGPVGLELPEIEETVGGEPGQRPGKPSDDWHRSIRERKVEDVQGRRDLLPIHTPTETTAGSGQRHTHIRPSRPPAGRTTPRGIHRHSDKHATGKIPGAQCAFKVLMIHEVLQFALRIAFRCVLHRCGNLDIHR